MPQILDEPAVRIAPQSYVMLPRFNDDKKRVGHLLVDKMTDNCPFKIADQDEPVDEGSYSDLGYCGESSGEKMNESKN